MSKIDIRRKHGQSIKAAKAAVDKTVAAIAKKFGVTENALLKANGISDPRKLQVGQRIVIPSRKPKY